jgi:hypothetical protein
MTKLEKKMINFLLNVDYLIKGEVYQYQNTLYWKDGDFVRSAIIVETIKNKKILYHERKRCRDSKVKNTYVCTKNSKSLFKEYAKIKPKLKTEQILMNWK